MKRPDAWEFDHGELSLIEDALKSYLPELEHQLKLDKGSDLFKTEGLEDDINFGTLLLEKITSIMEGEDG